MEVVFLVFVTLYQEAWIRHEQPHPLSVAWAERGGHEGFSFYICT